MTQHEQAPQIDTHVEGAPDAQVEAAEQTPAEQAEALQTRLDTIVEANNTLETQVDDTAREAAFEYAVDHPEAAAADAAMLEKNLPKTDGSKLAELAGMAKDQVVEVAKLPDDQQKGFVDKFFQKHFGGSLADVAAACGDMLMPGSDIFRAVMKGEMPKGRDVARLASGMFAPPIGTVIFDMISPKQGGTPEEVKRAAIKGRLSADLIRAVGFFLPEVATVTEPASKVMREVSNQVEKTAQKGDTTAADRAKAMGRGLIANKENLTQIAQGLGVEMSTDSALARAGITGESAETVKAVGRIIAEDPDKAGKLLERMFSDGGIVEEQDGSTPAGAIEMRATA